MDINFKILIIDDNDDIIETYSEELTEYMLGKGFKLSIDNLRSQQEYLQKNVELNKFNLFLIDLNFDTIELGTYFIDEIKKKCPVADILFYSSDGKAIMAQRQSKDYEGIYFAQRDDTVDEILPTAKKLLDKGIKNSESIVNVRGIILQNMSICDEKIKEKLDYFCLHFDGDWGNFKKKTFVYIDKSISHKYRYFLKAINYDAKDINFANRNSAEFTNSEIELSVLYSDYRIVDSKTKFQILCYFLNYFNIDCTILSERYEELSDVRNLLAHKVEYNEDGDIVLRNEKKVIILNEENCRNIRVKLLELLESLNEIKILNKTLHN